MLKKIAISIGKLWSKKQYQRFLSQYSSPYKPCNLPDHYRSTISKYKVQIPDVPRQPLSLFPTKTYSSPNEKVNLKTLKKN